MFHLTDQTRVPTDVAPSVGMWPENCSAERSLKQAIGIRRPGVEHHRMDQRSLINDGTLAMLHVPMSNL